MKVLLVFLSLVAAYIDGMIHILYMIQRVLPLSWCFLAAEIKACKQKLEQAEEKPEEDEHE